MQREKSTDRRIVKAAVKLFSGQGFVGGSTQEIARLAGVNEITVFRHFPRKRDLFWAAAAASLDELRLGAELRKRLDEDEDPRTALPEIVSLLVQSLYRQPRIARLLYASLFELDHDAEPIMRNLLAAFFQPIHGYLSRCAQRGAIRDIEPEIALLGLASIVFTHEKLQQVLVPLGFRRNQTDAAVRGYTNFWVRALLPGPCVAGSNL